MTTSSISSRVHQVLDGMNLDPAYLSRRDPADLQRRAEAVLSEIPVMDSRQTPLLRLLNALECEGYVPPKVAAFLKNNLQDRSFAASLLTKTIEHLGERGMISLRMKNHLFDKIQKDDFGYVIQILYGCMILPNPKSEIDQEELIVYTRAELANVISHREQVRCRELLKSKILTLSHGLKQQEKEQYVSSLIEALESNDPKKFKAHFPDFLDYLKNKQTHPIRKYCFEDLKETCLQMSSKDFFLSLFQAFQAQEFYGGYLAQVRCLTGALQQASLSSLPSRELEAILEKCKVAYQNMLYITADFKNMPCISKTAFSYTYGELRSEWMKINRLFASHKHLFCDCHASGHPKAVWPLYDANKIFCQVESSESMVNQGESVAVLGCDWGNGHRSASQNITKICEKAGYHPISVNVPTEILADEDPVSKLLGSKKNVGWLTNGLAYHGAFRILNFLKKIASPKPPEESTVKKVVQHFLRIRPSFLISSYSRHNEEFIKAAEILGLPLLHVSTDIDVTVETRKEPPSYPHFKMTLPFGDEEIKNKVAGKTVRESQLVLTGPPVKAADDQDRTKEEILVLKRKWGIPEHKKVVIVTNGGNGSLSSYPEMLVKKYAKMKPEEVPFHLIVLCGKNKTAQQEYLMTKVAPKATFKMDPYTFVPPEQMEELISMASLGGCVIGKAGGMTLFELLKHGTRILVDEIPHKASKGGPAHFFLTLLNKILYFFRIPNKLSWEEFNQDYASRLGLAEKVRNQKEFYSAFEKVLGYCEPVRMHPSPKFTEELPRVIETMKHQVLSDGPLQVRTCEVLDAQKLLL